MHSGELPLKSWVTPVVLAKLLVSGGVLLAGFRALSDDDYARVVIAQSFAESPRWDPSGTSWLPLPFWTQGGVMLVFGRLLLVAQTTAIVAGVLSALAVVIAARWCGATTRAALVAALGGCLLPHAAWLGVATVPDGPAAALLLLGMAAASTRDARPWAVGCAGLLAATLMRYEAWPVACGLCALGAVDARRSQDWRRAAWGALALLGPLAWMAHGALDHGDATFFLKRVAAYRQAIGASPTSLLVRTTWYPWALIRYQPELVVVLLASLFLAYRGRELARLKKYVRPAWLALALLAFLVVGDLGDGAATHHRERTLLSLWWLGAVVSADLWEGGWAMLGRRTRAVSLTALVFLVGLTPIFGRKKLAEHDAFARRTEEVAIGERARLEAAKQPGRLLVDTKDYGYFAVLAGFGSPEQGAALDEHDPRRAGRTPAAFSSLAELRQRIDSSGAHWLVATREHESLAREVGVAVAENPGFVLVRVGR